MEKELTFTPKKRAEELINLMAISTSYGTNYTGGDDILMYRNIYAKECAIIAVDEVIANIEPSVSMDVISARIKYWEQVKTEINKL
jgi:hypothetical protein